MEEEDKEERWVRRKRMRGYRREMYGGEGICHGGEGGRRREKDKEEEKGVRGKEKEGAGTLAIKEERSNQREGTEKENNILVIL